jgi:hypothetical protein
VTELHAFVTAPGYEAPLAAELGAPPGPRWPGVVTAAGPVGIDPVWSRQSLPGAVSIKGASVRALAEAAYAAVEGTVDAANVGDGAGAGAGFTLHAFVPDPEAYRTVAARAELVGEAVLALLRERRRRAFRRYVPPAEAGPRWGELTVLQLALVGRTSLLASAARPAPLPRGGFDLVPWPAGIAAVEEDRRAPSRAYGKLEEAFAWMGVAPAPGQRCVDLGGSPGGWAWKALSRGAEVVAVDRAPLAPPAAGHPALTMVRGNAFSYEPAGPVDWLLCDVICEPARTLELVDRWIARGWCRAVVATMKFKGASGYGLLAEASRHLGAHRWRYQRLKHLYRHHNEVAVMMLR